MEIKLKEVAALTAVAIAARAKYFMVMIVKKLL